MIITKIQGGLGNQMFQYAYSRSLSLKYGVNFYLETSFFNMKSTVSRFFSLDQFPSAKINLDIPKNNNPNCLITDDFTYKDLCLKSNINYYLDGYWQSKKYFVDYFDQIIYDFSPSHKIKEDLNSFIKGKTISLHVRRTDYLTSNGYHPVQSLNYYKKALDILGKYDSLIVFSDDIEWCRTNLNFERITFCELDNDLHQLWLMSLCHNNIIANSTFSWWGALLNKNLNKTVIAPKMWFGSQTNLNDSDIIPDEWIKI